MPRPPLPPDSCTGMNASSVGREIVRAAPDEARVQATAGAGARPMRITRPEASRQATPLATKAMR